MLNVAPTGVIKTLKMSDALPTDLGKKLDGFPVAASDARMQ